MAERGRRVSTEARNQGQYNSQSLKTLEGPLTKNKPHALRSGWPCGSRPQSRSRAGRALGLPMGDILLVDGPHVAVATPSPLQKRTSGNTTRAHVVPRLLWGWIGPTLAHAGTCKRTLNTVHTSRRQVEPSPPRGRRWARLLRRPPEPAVS